jgi:hypothetical protein
MNHHLVFLRRRESMLSGLDYLGMGGQCQWRCSRLRGNDGFAAN